MEDMDKKEIKEDENVTSVIDFVLINVNWEITARIRLNNIYFSKYIYTRCVCRIC